MSKYRSIAEADVRGKRVLMRVDHNIELDPTGALKNDKKIRATLPSIHHLLEHGARLILMTHVGRPKGKADPKLSTATVAKHLQTLIPNSRVTHVTETVGPAVQKAVSTLKDGQILYLENVRFSKAEEGSPTEQEQLGKDLATLADIFVNEAFASCHEYEEASTCAVSRLLPSYAGLHLEKEATMLRTALDDPRRPVVLVISGAKMETKIPVVENFLMIGDDIFLGGCIANTFIAARGFNVAKSKYEEAFIPKCQELMLEADKMEKANIHVPRDAVVASAPTEDAVAVDLPVEDVIGDMAIFDVGKVTTERFVRAVEKAGTIVWNGPLGLYEIEQFAGATKRLSEAIKMATAHGATSIIGGGDTLDFHKRYGISLDGYTFVSTGGGAMLEFISGRPFPAFAALEA